MLRGLCLHILIVLNFGSKAIVLIVFFDLIVFCVRLIRPIE